MKAKPKRNKVPKMEIEKEYKCHNCGETVDRVIKMVDEEGKHLQFCEMCLEGE